MKKKFREKLEHLINRESMENGSNTPDYILAQFLLGCLKVFDEAVSNRDYWYHGDICSPGKMKGILSD
jgi:hypothetical protein